MLGTVGCCGCCVQLLILSTKTKLSAITKVTSQVDDVALRVAAVLVPTAATGPAAVDVAALRTARATVDDAVTRLRSPAVAGELTKLVVKAKETDPDKKLFGPQMVERVLALAARVDVLVVEAEDKQRALVQLLEPLEHREALERAEAQRVQQARQQAQREADEAQRKREEEAAAAAAIEQARRRALEETIALVAFFCPTLSVHSMHPQQRRLENEAADREKEERDKAAAQARAYKRDLEKQRLQQEQQDARQRKEDAVALGLRWSLGQLQSRAPSRLEHVGALQTLLAILGYIMEDPSNPMYRRLRHDNRELQRDLLRHHGGVECVLSLGFVERDEPLKDAAAEHSVRAGDLQSNAPTSELVYVLAEPDMRDKPEEWVDWYEKLKQNRDDIAKAVDAAKRARS